MEPIVSDALTDLCREGARKMLQAAIEKEVEDYINMHKDLQGSDGYRLVVSRWREIRSAHFSA